MPVFFYSIHIYLSTGYGTCSWLLAEQKQKIKQINNCKNITDLKRPLSVLYTVKCVSVYELIKSLWSVFFELCFKGAFQNVKMLICFNIAKKK